jgi:hypothetical protein
MDANFEERLKLEVAAQDSDLRAFFELAMQGGTKAVSEMRTELIELMDDSEVLQLRNDIMRTYNLSENELTRVIGSCVADIAGVQKGKDFFIER